MSSVEIVVILLKFQKYFYFPIEKNKLQNYDVHVFSSRKNHSGTFHCPGMDLPGTRDILSHSGTVPGNPGHLVTLM